MSNEAPTDALGLVPAEATDEMIAAWYAEVEAGIFGTNGDNGKPHEEYNRAAYRALIAAAPASPLPGGGPYERWSILNHLGESWTPENFDTERQATAFLDRWKRDNPKMDLSKHKVIPVLVTMTAAPTGEPK